MEVTENGSRVISSAAWADMLLAWARDRAMRFSSVLGMLGNLPRCCSLRTVRGKSLVLWSQDLAVLLSVGDRIVKSCWCGEVYS